MSLLKKFSFAIFFSLLLISCGSGKKEGVTDSNKDAAAHANENDTHDDHGKNKTDERAGDHGEDAHGNSADTHDEKMEEVELTDAQFRSAGVVIASLQTRSLSGKIKANGVLDVPPQNMVSISPPMGGFLKTTDLLQGMHVEKGQTIAILQHQDYIQLQEDFLDTRSQLDYLETEYKRQVELSKESINSQKILQQAKSHYESMLAKHAGLRAKLNLLGINPTGLTASNLQSSINIYAPISGYVTKVNVNIGMYVSAADVMFVIVDTEHLHAELTLFEKDVPFVKVGQKVTFTLANEHVQRNATVHLVGRQITEDRTVQIHCHLDKEDKELIPGMYLKAFVETTKKTALSIPEEGVVDFEGKYYVFVSQPAKEAGIHHFSMVPVFKGISEGGYTEIELLEDIGTAQKFVTKGSYDILAVLKNGEDEGGHAH